MFCSCPPVKRESTYMPVYLCGRRGMSLGRLNFSGFYLGTVALVWSSLPGRTLFASAAAAITMSTAPKQGLKGTWAWNDICLLLLGLAHCPQTSTWPYGCAEMSTSAQFARTHAREPRPVHSSRQRRCASGGAGSDVGGPQQHSRRPSVPSFVLGPAVLRFTLLTGQQSDLSRMRIVTYARGTRTGTADQSSDKRDYGGRSLDSESRRSQSG